jgi:diguanylate cyclase (GGDEF)-like protein
MDEKLQIWGCETYRREIQSLITSSKWIDHNFELQFMPPICILPQLKANAITQIKKLKSDTDNILLLGSCCEDLHNCQAIQNRARVNVLPQCFYMVTNPTLVDHLMATGAYVITPGWLKTWRQKLGAWGFDQPTARDFFHESTRKLTLLDTGIDPESASQLEAFGRYVDLPTDILPVGMDHFDLYFSNAVAEHNLEMARRKTKSPQSVFDHQIADSAMAVDLLIQLTGVQSEEEAILQILDIFTILFSPGQIQFCSVNGDKLISRDGNGIEISKSGELLAWVNLDTEEFRLIPSEEGFYLRFSHLNETMGVLYLGDFRVPGYIQQYLNLSLSIAPLCALAISNTRTFQKLQDAEKIVRRDKEVSDTLRQIMTDLSSQIDVPGVQNQFLKSLFWAIPYSTAAIFKFNQMGVLEFQMGMQATDDGGLIPFEPHIRTIENGKSILQGLPGSLEDIDEDPLVNQYFGSQDIHGWLGVLFYSRGELMGIISIGRRQKGGFSKDETSLAQSIVNVSSIARENARLFSEVQTLAATDSLTGLFNRRHFYELAELEMKRSLRYERPLSVIMADIDFFKKVNDSYGHAVGDLVLREAATILKQNTRETDIVGRYGGEEFVLMLPETNLENALSLAERIRAAVSHIRIPNEKKDVFITISLGVAEYSMERENLDALLNRSDQALYEAKKTGRNRVCSFSKKSLSDPG